MMNALVVVAHDDDVVLWMGGVVHHISNWKWHLVAMCNHANIERKRYFQETSSQLGARFNVMDFRNYQNKNAEANPNSIDQMKHALLEIVGGETYDYVFTHSRDPNGEYNRHDNHQEVWNVVRDLTSEGKLVETISRLAHFSYAPIYRTSGLATVARQDAKYFFQLTYKDLTFKVQMVRSHMDSIVNNLEQSLGSPCPNPEAFEGENLILPPPFRERGT